MMSNIQSQQEYPVSVILTNPLYISGKRRMYIPTHSKSRVIVIDREYCHLVEKYYKE